MTNSDISKQSCQNITPQPPQESGSSETVLLVDLGFLINAYFNLRICAAENLTFNKENSVGFQDNYLRGVKENSSKAIHRKQLIERKVYRTESSSNGKFIERKVHRTEILSNGNSSNGKFIERKIYQTENL